MQQEQYTCIHVPPRTSTPTGRRFSAAALTTLRERAGLSRQQLAERIGRDRQSIRLYELDQAQPPIEVADRIAYALGVALDDLLA